MTPAKEYEKHLITEYNRAKETLVSRFSMPLEKREARETINATLLLCSAEQAKIIIKELPAEFQAGLYIESDYLSRKVPAYTTIDFSRISKTHLKKITRQTIGDIGNFNDELANNLRWKYNGLLANNELVNQIEKYGWTANAEKRMLKMGLDKETINLIKQQTTAKKMIEILETQGIKGGLHPNEVSKLLQPHIRNIFGDGGVFIDNIGKMRRQFVIDADGKYKWIQKKITRPYRATIKTYSETISRSSMLSAHRSGRYETLQQSNLVEKYRSIAVMDAATGEVDAMMHGQIVSFGDGPPYHANCRCDLRPVWKKETGLYNHDDSFYTKQRDSYFWNKHQLKEYNKTLPKGKKIPNYNFLPKNALKGMPSKEGMRKIRAEAL